MPTTRCAMNSLSSQPFWKMCHIMPQITATSVPERCTNSVACAAVRVKRVDEHEHTKDSSPCRQHMLQRHGMGFRRVRSHGDDRLGVADVVVGIRLARRSPMVLATPATVVEWQMRA